MSVAIYEQAGSWIKFVNLQKKKSNIIKHIPLLWLQVKQDAICF